MSPKFCAPPRGGSVVQPPHPLKEEEEEQEVQGSRATTPRPKKQHWRHANKSFISSRPQESCRLTKFHTRSTKYKGHWVNTVKKPLGRKPKGALGNKTKKNKFGSYELVVELPWSNTTALFIHSYWQDATVYSRAETWSRVEREVSRRGGDSDSEGDHRPVHFHTVRSGYANLRQALAIRFFKSKEMYAASIGCVAIFNKRP